MYKYLLEIEHYIQYKILLGVFALIFTDSFFKLMFCFALIEFMDTFTRWICQSKKCWQSLYPNTPAGLWKYITFMWQARKWRFIRSDAMRNGADKILLYLIILLVATLVDIAMLVAGSGTRFCTVICVSVLGCTEALSILENLSEITNANVITKIKEKIKEKLK